MSVPTLVAFDLDGTLIGRDLGLSPRVRKAVAAMQKRGVRGAIVTGRMYRASVTFARELGFDVPIVCYQGAAIIDPSTDRVLRDIPIANSVVRKIIDIAAREALHLQLYRNDSYYCVQRNRFSDLYASLAQVEPIIVPSLREAFVESDATKAVIIVDANNAENYATALRSELGAEAYVTRSYPEFIEILNPRVDKGDALRFLAERIGVDLADVLAIGDSWNDAPLLKAAGFGVAMGSAPDELRAVANAVVGDVAHDGVADAIERYVLG